ncbi:MAG TPA: anaerobic glycerol-3-phosphate dehydrogenase subunit C [Symbiobacteriaceae bacterium]|nr:anaerobic glycerol-3-phosphate dehydrogenase subunit C [Symbiobacteriaceae bacterium]
MEKYDACLKCSLCELHCPVFRVAPAFPGPKNGGPGFERLRAAGRPVDESGLDLCLGCRTCEVVCPSHLEPAALIHQVKIEKVAKHGLPAREWILTHTELLGGVASRMAPVANSVTSLKPVRVGMEKTLRIDRRRPMPQYAQGTFRSWFARRVSPWRDRPAPNGKVVYFHGCSTNYMLHEIGRQTVAVLEHNGFEVVLPKQRCCGLPLIGNGELKEARNWASYNVGQLRSYALQGIPIIFTSTSCSLTVKQEYEHLLGIPGASEVAAQCYDFFEFLAHLHDEGKLRTDFHRVEEELPYHQPCHQRVQGIGTPAVRLLRLIPGVRAWALDAGCCGASGTHGFKQEKYDLSMAVGKPLADAILATGARRAVSECEACRWQMEHSTGRTAVHPVSVLAEAYGLK